MQTATGMEETTPRIRNKHATEQRAATSETTPLLQNEVAILTTGGSEASSLEGAALHHRTSALETFIHLLKGYIGAGMLSLPWAFSNLGIFGGVCGVCTLCWWTSYNCYTVVSIKRYMEKVQGGGTQHVLSSHLSDLDERNSETSSNITYPDVGEWAYGATFQSYVSTCIIVQQLAVCTVYVSFCGENLQAVLQYLGLHVSHVSVMSMALPPILLLSFIPSLKQLAPVMAIGMALLISSLAALGVIVGLEWENRPDESPEIVFTKVPLALCAIIYSYEGICIILPVESAMQNPSQFGRVFIGTMMLVGVLYAVVATICVTAFGNVTSGILTAFLLETVGKEDREITTWVNIANTAVSFSVLLTYPLTIWPALELLSITVADSNSWFATCLRGGKDVETEEEDPLAGFEPLPPLPEDDVASIDSSIPVEHYYGQEESSLNENEAASASGMSSSMVSTLVPKLDMPGDSLQLRALLVLSTYFIAVVIPNVQALISLAGAVAGSSTALIIPPLVELAWVEHLEHCDEQVKSNPESLLSPTLSPHVIRTTMRQQHKKKQKIGRWTRGNYWKDRIKCDILLVFGAVFMAIGTFASILDIFRIYSS